MARIFLSYRHSDVAGYAGRLYDCLSHRFGPDQIFRDIEVIEPGADFFDAIERSATTCDVLIAVIGKDWLTITDDQGRRRLDSPGDMVRLEIEAALTRDIPVIPVLVGGASMPRADDLPGPLSALARREALDIDEKRFQHDVGRLIHILENHVPSVSYLKRFFKPGKVSVAAGLAISVVAAMIFLLKVSGKVDVTGVWLNDERDTPFPARLALESDGKTIQGTVWALADGLDGPLTNYGIQNGKIDGRNIGFTTRKRLVRKPAGVNPSTRTLDSAEYEYGDAAYTGKFSDGAIRLVYQGRDGHIPFTVRRINDKTRRPAALTSTAAEGSHAKLRYERVYSLPGHPGGVNSLAFADSSGWLLVSGGLEDGQVKFWRTPSAELRWSQFADGRQTVGSVTVGCWTGTAHMAVQSFLVPRDGGPVKIRLWRTRHFYTSISGTSEETAPGRQFAVTPDGRHLAMVEGSGMRVWGTGSFGLAPTEHVIPSRGAPAALAAGEDAREELIVILAENFQGTGFELRCVKVSWRESPFDRPTSSIIWSALVGPTRGLGLSPRSDKLAVTSAATNDLVVIDAATGKATRTLPTRLAAGAPSFGYPRDGSLLAYGSASSHAIEIWETATGVLRQTLEDGGRVCALAFSGDGRLLASGDCAQGAIHVWALSE